jgi:hypothetical protein
MDIELHRFPVGIVRRLDDDDGRTAAKVVIVVILLLCAMTVVIVVIFQSDWGYIGWWSIGTFVAALAVAWLVGTLYIRAVRPVGLESTAVAEVAVVEAAAAEMGPAATAAEQAAKEAEKATVRVEALKAAKAEARRVARAQAQASNERVAALKAAKAEATQAARAQAEAKEAEAIRQAAEAVRAEAERAEVERAEAEWAESERAEVERAEVERATALAVAESAGRCGRGVRGGRGKDAFMAKRLAQVDQRKRNRAAAAAAADDDDEDDEDAAAVEITGRGPTTVHSLPPAPAPPSAPAPAESLMTAERPLTLADVGNFTGRVHDDAPESTIGGQTTCIVCMVGPKSHLAVPCGHQLACVRCTTNMKICPYCRTPVQLWVMQRLV